MEELVKEQPVYEIQKVKIKNNQLTAEYTEKFVEANYKNNILKESEQFIHPDLLYALNRLKPHVVKSVRCTRLHWSMSPILPTMT